MKRFAAASRYVVLAHLRSFLIPLALAAFLALSSLLPTVSKEATPADARGLTAGVMGIGTFVLFILALTLPLDSIRLRRPGGLNVPGPSRLVFLGCFVGHTLVFLLTALSLGGAGILVVSLRLGWLDSPGALPVFRPILASAPSVEEAARPGTPFQVTLMSSPLRPGGERRSQSYAWLRLHPKVRLLPGSDALDTEALRGDMLLRYRQLPDRKSTEQRLSFRRVAEREVEILLREVQNPIHLNVEVEAPSKRAEARFDHDTILLLGPRTRYVTSVFRGFLGLALTALLAMVFTHWFSAFVGPGIAFAATLTLGLVIAVLPSDLRSAILGSFDAVSSASSGVTIRWANLLDPLVRVLGALGATTLLLYAAPLDRSASP